MPSDRDRLQWSRRQVIAGGIAVACGAGCRRGSEPAAMIASASVPAPLGTADVQVALRAVAGEGLLATDRGRTSRVWRFEGKLLAGPTDALSFSSQSYLGPTFRVRRGQRVHVRFDNALDEASIVHWHGLAVSQENDGHPRFAVEKGHGYTYDFTVDSPAGTYWYHPHPDGRTGPQVYAGMAGIEA